MAEKHVHKVYGSFPPWGKSVEFPASGGGNYVYFDTSSMNDNEDYTELKDNMLCYAAIVKYPHPESNEVLIRCPYDCDLDDKFSIYAMGFDFSLKVQVWNADSEEFLLVSVEEAIREYLPEILDLPRLTEEEFYKIAPRFAILHRGGGENVTIHEYEEGMTWGEWVNSDYNTINALISDNNQVQILIPNNDWNATLGSKIDGWLYSDNIIKSEQYDAYY